MARSFSALAVGWDVGGWMGDKQAVAVIGLDDDGSFTHLGVARTFKLSLERHVDVLELLREGWPEITTLPPRIALGIDAPLSFPRAFVRLLAGEAALPTLGPRELDNPLAYRACDRWIAETHGKKPLSASFDRLGNNATLAMTLARAFRAQGFTLAPFDAPGERVAFEAYPALYKDREGLVPAVRPLLPRRLPTHDLRSDALDATLCALSAMMWLGASDPRVPSLVGPDPSENEGWIYAPPASWLRG